ncbi:MAG: response regulator transcription factor [Blautia sp.]|nr:response regulator transcription factor [Blautia sp.]
MIKIAIVEDEQIFSDCLKTYLDTFETEEAVDFQTLFYQDGEDIVENYQADFDLILMDIQMRFLNGIDAARQIRERDPDVLIIFITSAAEFAIKGYEVRAFDYLLKPLSYETFALKLRRALDHVHKKKDDTLLLHLPEGVCRISIRRILYVESQSHTMYIYTKDGVRTTYEKLGELEKLLAPYHFFRCNKGYLVNMEAVDRMEDGDCFIGRTRIPISRRRRSEFMDHMLTIM